jgi:hypothetical protein
MSRHNDKKERDNLKGTDRKIPGTFKRRTAAQKEGKSLSDNYIFVILLFSN